MIHRDWGSESEMAGPAVRTLDSGDPTQTRHDITDVWPGLRTVRIGGGANIQRT